MKLEQAISILEDVHDDRETYLVDDDLTAINLGIEALKQIEKIRVTGVLPRGVSLPGETKD